MDWVRWVIPLIAVAVFILSHLASRQQEKMRREQKPAPLPPPLPPETRVPEREKEIRKPVVVESSAPRSVVRKRDNPPRELASAERPRPRMPAQNSGATTTATRETRQPSTPREATAHQAKAEGQTPLAPAVLAGTVLPATPATPEPMPPAAKASFAPPAPAASALVQLLQKRETIQAAFLLHELLGPPRCRTGPRHAHNLIPSRARSAAE